MKNQKRKLIKINAALWQSKLARPLKKFYQNNHIHDAEVAE